MLYNFWKKNIQLFVYIGVSWTWTMHAWLSWVLDSMTLLWVLSLWRSMMRNVLNRTLQTGQATKSPSLIVPSQVRWWTSIPLRLRNPIRQLACSQRMNPFRFNSCFHFAVSTNRSDNIGLTLDAIFTGKKMMKYDFKRWLMIFRTLIHYCQLVKWGRRMPTRFTALLSPTNVYEWRFQHKCKRISNKLNSRQKRYQI